MVMNNNHQFYKLDLFPFNTCTLFNQLILTANMAASQLKQKFLVTKLQGKSIAQKVVILHRT